MCVCVLKLALSDFTEHLHCIAHTSALSYRRYYIAMVSRYISGSVRFTLTRPSSSWIVRHHARHKHARCEHKHKSISRLREITLCMHIGKTHNNMMGLLYAYTTTHSTTSRRGDQPRGPLIGQTCASTTSRECLIRKRPTHARFIRCLAGELWYDWKLSAQHVGWQIKHVQIKC